MPGPTHHRQVMTLLLLVVGTHRGLGSLSPRRPSPPLHVRHAPNHPRRQCGRPRQGRPFHCLGILCILVIQALLVPLAFVHYCCPTLFTVRHCRCRRGAATPPTLGGESDGTTAVPPG